MLSDRLCSLLTAFVDDELADPQRQDVLRLLRESPEARSLLREFQQDADHLRRLPRQVLDVEFSHQLVQKIAGQLVPVPRSRYAALTVRSQVPPWVGLATAAAVLVMVGVGSYLYFTVANVEENKAPRGPLVAADREVLPEPDRDALAAGNRATDSGAGPSVPETESNPSRTNARELVKTEPAQPELLPSPAPEETVFGIRVSQTEGFSKVDLKLSLNLRVRDLDQERRKQRLLEELRKGPAYRLDLGCLEALPAVERMQAAFKTQGIRLLIEQSTQTALKLRFKDPASYAVYTENVTPEEVLAVVQYLRSEDRKAETKRSGPAQFDALVINAMTANDHRELCKLLGIDPDQLEPRKPMTPLDIHKPLATGTTDEVVQALIGQGTPRPEPGKPIATVPERIAVLVPAYHFSRPRPSREVKLFLDSRKERVAGTLQMLLVLRSTRG